MKEIFVNFLCQTPTILVVGMCIEVCYHPCLRVPGVTLNCFDVAAAKTEAKAMVPDGETVNEITPVPTAPACGDEGYKYEFAGWTKWTDAERAAAEAEERKLANWNFENLIYEDNLRVYAKWSKVKDTSASAFSATLIVNCQDENGTVLDYEEITLTAADWSYTPAQKITVGSDNYTYEGISANSPVRDLSGTVRNGRKVLLILNYAKDNWDDENNEITGGDNIPDKYQAVVNFVAGSNGTLTGTVPKTQIITLKENGSYLEKQTAEVIGPTASPDSNYKFTEWTGDASYSTADFKANMELEGGHTYTVTANFQYKGSTYTPDPDNGKGQGEETKKPEVPLPETPIEEPEVPLAPLSETPIEEPEVEIPEEKVPLADAPETGDTTALWLAMTALSGCGLAGVSLLGRKKREDEE